MIVPTLIVPTLCVGMHPVTLCVTTSRADAERPWRHSHAERGNDHWVSVAAKALACSATSVTAVLSHHIPRNGGPMANSRWLTWP